jgi:hypothetical protein
MTYVDVNGSDQPHPGAIEARSLIAGGLPLIALFLLLFIPVGGAWPGEVVGRLLRAPLQELTAVLAAIVAVLCLLRWRVTSDTQALHIGLAMTLYGAALATTSIEQFAALQPASRLVVIALLGHALLMSPTAAWPSVARTLLLTLIPLVALSMLLRTSQAPGLSDALPGILFFGLGVTYAALGIQEGRHLFAWSGVMLVGLAVAELAATVPALTRSLSPLDALCPAALLLGGLGGYRDVQQAFAAQRQRMLASQATALEAQTLGPRPPHGDAGARSRGVLGIARDRKCHRDA